MTSMTPPPQKKYVDPITRRLFKGKMGVDLDEFIGDFCKSVAELEACHELLVLCVGPQIHAKCHRMNSEPTKSQAIAGEYGGVPADKSKELGDCLYNMCKFLAFKYGDAVQAASIISEANKA